MRDLLTDPACSAEDLGCPLPDSPHAVSVCLPRWADVVGYEEQHQPTVDRMQCGYPRFFLHPKVRHLFAEAEKQCAESGEHCVVYPSRQPAERCVAYVREKGGNADLGRVVKTGWGQLHAAVVPAENLPEAMAYWRHCGEVVSSRLAEAISQGQDPEADEDAGRAAKEEIRQRLAQVSGQNKEDVFLFPSGMAAVFTVHRILNELFPGRKSVQLEFPYVDVLKIQEEFGPGVHFIPLIKDGGVEEVEALLAKGETPAAVYCELASNPLLRSVDVLGLKPVLEAAGVPMIVDDTVGCVLNIDAFRAADVVTSSLTKYFSGSGDVMAGSVILRHDSPFREAFRERLLAAGGMDELWTGDAVVLATNSRGFQDRVAKINQNADRLFSYLENHPKVEAVWYPRNQMPEIYRQIHRESGGYGGLLSILLKDPARAAPRFYDALRISKGPSLGTNFSLVCPYTLLAHYQELDWAARCGVDRHLIRISVGLEDPEDLIQRFDEAFAAAG